MNQNYGVLGWSKLDTFWLVQHVSKWMSVMSSMGRTLTFIVLKGSCVS
uniref:Uncharacterized protein n=1 Tax=Rhizophora mucronata TaxID=61149 RepID=A0A2P2NR37_RHIMU